MEKSDRESSIASQVERIRSAILQRHGYQSESDIKTSDASSAIDEAARLSVVKTHWGIASEIPVAGRLVVLAQRVIRIALRWYVNPIVDQQNAFNDAVMRTLHELQAENERLRAMIAKPEREDRES